MEPLGYSVESRKAATDAGSRSVAEAEVLVGGEVLRGTAVGGGPVDALEKALRAALAPVYPALSDVALVDFSSSIVDKRVQVSVAGRLGGGGEQWRATAVADDLLHASWLAVADCFYQAIAGERVPAVAPEKREYPSVEEVAVKIHGWLDPDDEAVLDRLSSTDWSTTRLDLSAREDRWFAACATALGATLSYGFGGYCAVAGHPRLESIQRINLQRGRPVNQVGSITSTRIYFASLFDWSLLPSGLTRDLVMALMDDFFELGPFGFRGPAAPSVSTQLTSFDGEVKTTQLIGPGYGCPSNDLVQSILGMVGREYLLASWAEDDIDLGGEEGVVVIGEDCSDAAAAPSVLAFHRLVDGALVLERQGSLSEADVRRIVEGRGLGLVVA